MSLLESFGVATASINSVDLMALVPLNSTITSDNHTIFPEQTEANGIVAGVGPSPPAMMVTPTTIYPRRSSLLWTLILTTSISAVDLENMTTLTQDQGPIPGTPHRSHQLRSDSNSSSGNTFGTNLKISRSDTSRNRMSKKTSDVLDPGNASSGVSMDHEQGRKGARQARSSSPTFDILGPDEAFLGLGMLEDEVSNRLSFHPRNINITQQPDDEQQLESSSPTTAAPLAKFVTPPESVTSNVVTAGHVLDFHVESFGTTPGEPETLSAVPPPSTPVLKTTMESPQDFTTLDQTSGDSSEMLTTSLAQSSSVDIKRSTTLPSKEPKDNEPAKPETNFNEYNSSLLPQYVNDLAEVSSITTERFGVVFPESGITHVVTSGHTVLAEETTEPSNFETSMPQDPDTVRASPTGLATIVLNRATKPLIAVTPTIENSSPSLHPLDINYPESGGVDTLLPESVSQDIITPEPFDVHAGLPEPQTPQSVLLEPINKKLTPSLQNSNSTALQPDQIEVPEPDQSNSAAPEIPIFHESEMYQNVSERFAGNRSNDSLNATGANNTHQRTLDGVIHWSVSRVLLLIIQLVIMVETVLGNLMVILSVKMEKKLQTPFNYYIVNLAFTDMNVGLSVMSLFMVYNLYDYFPFGSFLCDYWIWSDYTMTFESVMTLAAISLDRLWSVTWSLHYRNHNSGRKSLCIILATWCLVAFIWIPPFIYDRVTNTYTHGDCYWDTVLNKNLVIYVGFLGYYTPLLVMLGAYARILWVVRKRAASIRDAGRKLSVGQATQPTESSGSGTAGGGEQSLGVTPARVPVPAPSPAPIRDDRQEAKLRREMKAVYTLLNIVVIFLICWVPFYTLFVLSAWHPTLFPTWYVTFSYWMAYINSALNPILYPLSSPEFRAAYKQVLITIMCKK